MKKIASFFLFSSLLFAQNIGLEDVLSLPDSLSAEQKIKELRLKSNKEEALFYKLGDFNGVRLEYVHNIHNFDSEHKNTDSTSSLSFGPIFASYTELKAKNSSLEGQFSIGIRKNIKDVFYSSYDSEYSKTQLNKIIAEIESNKMIAEKKIEIVNLYKDIAIKQFEIYTSEKSVSDASRNLKNIRKLYELGEIAKIDLELSKLMYDKAVFELNTSKLELANLLKISKTLLKFDLSAFKLRDIGASNFDIKNFEDNFGKKDIEKLEANLAISKESYSYAKYDDYMPDITLAYEHVYDRHGNEKDKRISIVFIKTLFDVDYKANLYENNLEIDKINTDKLINSVQTKKLELVKEYYNLKKSYVLSKTNFAIEETKYKIKKKEYELGKASYSDYLKTYDDFSKASLELTKLKNTLNAFIIELRIRSSI